MFEDQTFETIMARALDKVSDEYDKREGSVIYDALAPTCVELAQLYVALEYIIDEAFGDTASREYLIRICAEHGITPNEATYTIAKAEFNLPTVPIGTRFNINDYVYAVTEKISDGVYKLKCETAGRAPSEVLGDMLAIDYVNGLVTARLTEIITPGTDEESTESLRNRYFSKVQLPGTSGNVYDYKQWALEVAGVGNAKVFPLFNGPGTVQILVIDSNSNIDETLEPKVHEYIESVRPIGAKVTIDSPEALGISITANITLDGSKLINDIKTNFEKSVTSYLKETIFTTYTVSYAKIGSLLLNTDGVEDYNTLLLNGNAESITVGNIQIPVLSTVGLEAV